MLPNSDDLNSIHGPNFFKLSSDCTCIPGTHSSMCAPKSVPTHKYIEYILECVCLVCVFSLLLFFYVETRYYQLAQDGLKLLVILLVQPPECGSQSWHILQRVFFRTLRGWECFPDRSLPVSIRCLLLHPWSRAHRLLSVPSTTPDCLRPPKEAA